LRDNADNAPGRRVATTLLVIGAAAGCVLAATGLLRHDPRLPDTAVAKINDVTISREQLQQYVTLVNANSRTEKDANYILQRMIDEELLVQRGVELGLVKLDSTVRNAIVQSVTSRFTSTEDAMPVSDDDLLAYYESHISYFTPEDQLRVEVISPADFPLPRKPLTVKSLREYLGETVTARLLELSPGEQTGPIDANGQVFDLRLVARQAGEPPPLEAVRPAVTREYRRAQSEQAFRDYVAWLRDRADITIAGDAK
jgi:hypothetical protein